MSQPKKLNSSRTQKKNLMPQLRKMQTDMSPFYSASLEKETAMTPRTRKTLGGNISRTTIKKAQQSKQKDRSPLAINFATNESNQSK